MIEVDEQSSEPKVERTDHFGGVTDAVAGFLLL